MKKITSSIVALCLALMGLVLAASSASATNQDNTNHEDYWENQPGEVCEKVDDEGQEDGGYKVPDEPAGWDWSTLIIKKGDGKKGVENQVFENPVAGETYTWQGFEDKHDGGYSHVILCKVPETKDPEVTATPKFEESCELGGRNDWTETTTVSYVFDEEVEEWVAQNPVVETSEKVFTPWSKAELAERGCTSEPKTSQTSSTSYECGDDFATVFTTYYVDGKKVRTDVSTVKHDVVKCPVVEDGDDPVIPTVVAAGLDNSETSTSAKLAASGALVVLMSLVLGGLALVRRIVKS